MKLRKGGSNWVDGDRFFDRVDDIEALEEQVRDDAHTLLTAQRRMGKTSLVRELLRRLGDGKDFEPVFVDLERAMDPADVIAEIGVCSRSVQGVWHQVKSVFANVSGAVFNQIETLSVADVKATFRGGVSAGTWQQKGDRLLAALAENERPVVLAMDELPILVNRLLRGERGEGDITPKGRQAADEFLSWLRYNAQTHRGRIVLIVSGSVGLEPILQQAGLSAHANVFSPFNLKPWDEETAMECLAALAAGYDLELPATVRQEMCRRLRCQIPHHVQQFFHHMHQHLRRAKRREASLEDVAAVHEQDLLGAHGQMVLDHYEARLRMVLGKSGYPMAIDMLTNAAVNDGKLSDVDVMTFQEDAQARPKSLPIKDVLHTLEHDGYLAREDGGYRFVSGLLEDWWRARHGRHATSVPSRGQPKRPK